MSADWRLVDAAPPPEDRIVETMIFDARGQRDEALLRKSGNLWRTADNARYVYYMPTHWRPRR